MTDDGSRLWLRYDPLPPALADRARPHLRRLLVPATSPTANITRAELAKALPSLLGADIPQAQSLDAPNTLLVATPDSSPDLHALNWQPDLTPAGPEGFLIRRATLNAHRTLVIAANTDAGAMYGAFHLLRTLSAGQPLDSIPTTPHSPKIARRLLNHWDNLDGSIERGYAGKSLWTWSDLPHKVSPRYEQYARANASIGINGTVLNNVNATPKILTTDYLEKVAALATVFRPYNLRVYLSVNFASPKVLGNLPTADPLDPAVQKWWRTKADEIYNLIPDFGGFLVKANSEGQPGPQDYHRTHADGANLLADALAPHGGLVLWRAFVYNADLDPDRAKRAHLEFTRLDGQFLPNVSIQVKNGPIDFQPREPFHPLFGSLTKTPVAAELQITQEYLGHSTHLVFLAPLWSEFLSSHTHARNGPTPVSEILAAPLRRGVVASATTKDSPLKSQISNSPSEDASPPSSILHPLSSPLSCIAGVANTGSSPNWTAHDFAQSNWYAFGRLAWDPVLPPEHIADEWIPQTWTRDPRGAETIRHLLLTSWETFVSYSMPLGLHHLIDHQPHYAPEPWNSHAPRPDWTSTYYHQAAHDAIGFDRTRRGNHYVDQYHKPVADLFDDPDTCPEKFLLFFHRLPWSHKLKSGRTLWQELCHHYTTGRDTARDLEQRWATLSGKIDPARHKSVAERLAQQSADAAAWRRDCLTYFALHSKQPIPKD